MNYSETFSKESIEQIVGGNGGVFVADYLTGYINGKLGMIGAKQAVVATLVKALGGAAVMAAGDFTKRKQSDIGEIIIGAGTAPICTIANDWYKAIYGMDVGTVGMMRAGGARAKMAAPRARTIRAPLGGGGGAGSAGDLRLFVG